MNGRDLLRQSRETLGHLSTAQKTSLGALVLVGVVAMVGLMMWSARPDYTVLFSNLNEQDAGKVVNYLQESNIPYKIEMGGSIIKVPREKLYDVRWKLASMGLPEQKGVGYELFDKVNFGMSDFMQKLNYRRALEGELARTIIALEEVEAARVHLVMPEQSLFKEKERPITASVALKLKSNRNLTDAQVQGITFLVSGAVEGLTSDKVTIVDSKGNVLSNMMERDPIVALTSNQLQMQRQVEGSIQQNVQSMLDKLLGPNKSIVRATTVLDFKRIEEQRETYDNTNPVVRSEERTESNTTGSPNGNITNENTVTNYEVSRNVQKIVGGVGGIQKLSLAVLIDGTYKTVGEGSDAKRDYVPRTENELTAIGGVIKGAVGFDEKRGDRLELSNIAFDISHIEQQNEEFKQTERMDFWRMVIERGVMLIGVIIILLMVRGYLKRASMKSEDTLERALVELHPRTPELAPGGHSAGALGTGSHGVDAGGKPIESGAQRMLPHLDSQYSEEALEVKAIQEQLEQFVLEKPENASRLLKTWLVES